MKTLACVIVSCGWVVGQAASQVTYTPVSFTQLPGWQNGQQQQMISALQRSCARNQKLAKYRRRTLRGSKKWLTACKAVLGLSIHLSAQQARLFLQNHYQAYRITDKSGNAYGTFTGYYAPMIPGRLTHSKQFPVPLYGKPKGLTRVYRQGKALWRVKNGKTYARLPSREAISAGPLLPNTPVLAWVPSKVDRFFLQIQGSGTIELPHGQRLLLGYAGQNGYKYVPIGKYLVQNGHLSHKNVSMQSIRQWLDTHPHDAQRVMNLNPSFVFFRKLHVDQPIGAEGVSLTPERSLAVDPKSITYGSPVWLDTYLPKVINGKLVPGQTWQRLMVAQDTGGAIKGAVRGDVFWGEGARAQWMAGHMQSKGRYWVLLPKSR